MANRITLVDTDIDLEAAPTKTANGKGDMSDEVDILEEMTTIASKIRTGKEDARGHVNGLSIEASRGLGQSHPQEERARIGLGARGNIGMAKTSTAHTDHDRSENRAGIEDNGPDDLVHHHLVDL